MSNNNDERYSYSLADDYDGDYVWDDKLKAYRAPKYPGEKGDKMTFKQYETNDK